MSTMLAPPPHTTAPLDLSALPPSALLTESEVAPALRASKATLANWRTSTRAGQPKGPAFIKLAGTAKG
jgi:DNA-binding transcriptional regulator YiaG